MKISLAGIAIIAATLSNPAFAHLKVFNTHAATTDLVTNGSFELSNFADGHLLGWDYSNAISTGAVFDHSRDSDGGGWHGELTTALNITQFESLSQAVQTVAGKMYTFSYKVACFDFVSPYDVFKASWNGNVVTDLVAPGNFGYKTFSFNVKATGSSTILDFAAIAPSSAFGIDQISVKSFVSTVPEPATWLTLLLGFAGCAYGLQVRNRLVRPATA